MTLASIAVFVISAVAAYVGISLFAQLSGGQSASSWDAFLSPIGLIPLVVMVVANMFFALAIYRGFLVSRYAIPMCIAIGAITSFAYSVIFLGAEISSVKMVGVAVTIVGIILLGL